MTPEEEKNSLYVDGYLKEKLDNGKKLLAKNFDLPFIISGDEGTGKSTLGFVCGQYLSNMGLTINNIAEGSQDAMEKLEKLPDKSGLIVDEGELLFSSRETMSREQRKLTQIMKVIRQKNMFFILISPGFFDLSKYIAVDRAKFLLRTTVDKEFNRGYWQYWGGSAKKFLYSTGKKNFGSYNYPKPKLYGRFTNYIPPFNEEYLKLKRKSLKEAFEGKKEKERASKNMERRIIIAKQTYPDMSDNEIAVKLDCSPHYVWETLTKFNILKEEMANSLVN